jgi:hypothetical protein
MYGNGVSTQVKRRAFVTKVQVCVGTPIKLLAWYLWNVCLSLLSLFPVSYLDDKGPIYLRSCDKGAELRLALSETYTRISTTPPNTGISDRGYDCGRMPG